MYKIYYKNVLGNSDAISIVWIIVSLIQYFEIILGNAHLVVYLGYVIWYGEKLGRFYSPSIGYVLTTITYHIRQLNDDLKEKMWFSVNHQSTEKNYKTAMDNKCIWKYNFFYIHCPNLSLVCYF